jgi:ssDNA-binding Zn-finger/Zn-ribbon topoisomerase 1
VSTGKLHGKYHTCSNYPDCDAYVKENRSSGLPGGSLANAELRGLREEVHALFDPIWRTKQMGKLPATRWLAEHLKIHWTKAHVELLDEKLCRKALKVLKAREEKKSEDILV